MENNRNHFILKYRTQLMDGGPLHKEFVTQENKNLEEKISPG